MGGHFVLVGMCDILWMKVNDSAYELHARATVIIRAERAKHHTVVSVGYSPLQTVGTAITCFDTHENKGGTA